MASIRERRLQIALYPRISAAGLQSPVLAIPSLVPIKSSTSIREYGKTYSDVFDGVTSGLMVGLDIILGL